MPVVVAVNTFLDVLALTGKITMNSLPGGLSGSYPGLSTLIVPPCASIIPLHIANPKPNPPPPKAVLLVVCVSTSPPIWKRSKITSRLSCGMPMPVEPM